MLPIVLSRYVHLDLVLFIQNDFHVLTVVIALLRNAQTEKNTITEAVKLWGRLKMREWKKRYGQNCKGGKCRSKPYGTPINPRFY